MKLCYADLTRYSVESIKYRVQQDARKNWQKIQKGEQLQQPKQLGRGTVEMEIRGSMMSVREDIRILDATLRDGGLVNNFGLLIIGVLD